MAPEGHPSLPGWIEDTYFPLERYLCNQSDQDAVTHHQATKLIAEANPDLRDADIDHALNYLLNHGWLYEVNDQLFITELQCGESTESNN
jgi:hypothetical protein